MSRAGLAGIPCGLTGLGSGGEVERRQTSDDLLGFEGDRDDLADEAEYVLRVVVAVWVVDDAGALIGGDPVLIDHPFEGGAVAEAVVEGFGWDAAQGEEVVVAELGLVFRELHALDPVGDFGCRMFDLFELIGLLFFVVDVEFHEALYGGGEGVEVGWEGDAGEFALEVGGVAGAVLGVVEDGVGGVEDVPLGDLLFGVLGAKLAKSPVCDVIAAVCAIFVVSSSR